MLSTNMAYNPSYTRRDLVAGQTQKIALEKLMNPTQTSNASGHPLLLLHPVFSLHAPRSPPSESSPNNALPGLCLLALNPFHRSGASSLTPAGTLSLACHSKEPVSTSGRLYHTFADLYTPDIDFIIYFGQEEKECRPRRQVGS